MFGDVDKELRELPDNPEFGHVGAAQRALRFRGAGVDPVPAAPAPSAEAVRVLREAAAGPWPSPLSGRLQAEPLGRLPLADLLGLLAHLPGPPDTERWRFLGESTPTSWYRLLQPWVCLGILRHREDEPWPTSTRRKVLVDPRPDLSGPRPVAGPAARPRVARLKCALKAMLPVG